MSVRSRVVAGAVAVAAAAAVITVVVVGRDGDAEASSDDGLPPATTEVTRGTLVDSATEGGTLGYGAERSLATRLAGTVTWLPAEGDVVRRGEALYEVDADAVPLLYGDVPPFRDLDQGDEGRDVRQLEQNLWALGYRGFEVDGEFTYYTAVALENWQEDLGVEETGTLAMADVVVLDGPARVATVTAGLGDAVAPGSTMLSVTGTTPAVTVEVDPSDRRLAEIGTEAEVTLPDGSSAPVTVVDVSTEVTEGESGEESDTSTTVVVVAELQGGEARERAREYDAAAVDVTFTAGRRKNVLIVPVAALVALSEGGFGLEVVEDGSSEYVAVDAGLFSGGRVEVSGAGITEGTVVGVPE
ncbi:peptidoglycan-binding domain-containing protein [Nocardioides sp. HM23]|uniref:peptidoglycan-binding domain-containing protein n=1 Tax=Nocardioides bizhenqiangii TaxID=3095076 RepID=UPI002ACACBC6|nr:peptidoglycan-binding domain-containing protein [Nocardioides sp. HM23]MDZ5621429.1 peptidoglycan-binding domain-containing protein [Nocardioides sp. HM23]